LHLGVIGCTKIGVFDCAAVLRVSWYASLRNKWGCINNASMLPARLRTSGPVYVSLSRFVLLLLLLQDGPLD
jgi:hypothetical protein